MKKLLLILALVASTAFAQVTEFEVSITKNEDGSKTMVLSPESVKICDEQGGCKVLTRDAFMELMKLYTKKICGKEV